MKTVLLIILIVFSSGSNNADAQFTKLHDFSGTDGNNPYGDLLSDGTYLYGTTSQGGANNYGTVFKIKPDGTAFSKLLDFNGTGNGFYPYGHLISDGTFLYGMTTNGGTNSEGTIFKIKTDGTGYSKLLDFSGASTGSYPYYASLIFDGTFLYGIAGNGGVHDLGVVFKLKTDGTGYVKLFDFDGTVNGKYPYGSLFSDGTYLYGMTPQGGASSKGVVYKIKTDGTGFTKLLDFAGAANGGYPIGALISDGTFLYGMSQQGGTNNKGVIFKIKTDGTGYAKMLDFAGAANGGQPSGTLISVGPVLYGMTYVGGFNNMGVVFKIKPDGTGYSKVFDFSGAADGNRPFSSLISDGTFFYGVTTKGGVNDQGVVFKLIDSCTFASPVVMASHDTVCEGDTVRLSITGTTTGVQWQASVTGNNFTDISGADSSVYLIRPSQTGFYRVVVSSGACLDTSLPHSLVVNSLPSSPLVTASDSLICSGDSSQICSSGSYAHYLWNNAATGFCTEVKSAGGYWLTVSDANGCSAVSNHLNISVFPVSSVSLVVQGDTLSSINSTSYRWYFNDSVIQGANSADYVAHQSGYYAVQIVDTNGCYATSNKTNLIVTEINKPFDNNQWGIYPNPFTNFLFVTIENAGFSAIEVDLHNVLGSLVLHKAIDNALTKPVVINVDGLMDEVYFIRVKVNEQYFTQKIIKQ